LCSATERGSAGRGKARQDRNKVLPWADQDSTPPCASLLDLPIIIICQADITRTPRRRHFAGCQSVCLSLCAAPFWASELGSLLQAAPSQTWNWPIAAAPAHSGDTGTKDYPFCTLAWYYYCSFQSRRLFLKLVCAFFLFPFCLHIHLTLALALRSWHHPTAVAVAPSVSERLSQSLQSASRSALSALLLSAHSAPSTLPVGCYLVWPSISSLHRFSQTQPTSTLLGLFFGCPCLPSDQTAQSLADREPAGPSRSRIVRRRQHGQPRWSHLCPWRLR
jgi:hypothetical protein